MRRVLRLLGLSAFLVTGFLSARALADEPADDDAQQPAVEPEGEQPARAAPAAPAAEDAAPPPAVVAVPIPKPKLGDVSMSGYFRGGFGASQEKGRMTCFALANPAGLVSKYRLGNECEVWSETQFTVVAYAGEDGSVATLHFMPTVFIPTTNIGYSPTGVVNSPAVFTTSTGATLSFPNLYVDIKGINWLGGGTPWVGTRYYKRESVYISDFFYWNPSGVGGGIEDIHVGGTSMRLSFATFALDGEPAPPADATAPLLPAQTDFGFRHDLQLRGIKFWDSGEFQLGFQYIENFSNNPVTHGGWGGTLQFVQKVIGGDNKLAFQYGKGGGTGFGTLSRFYYPDFSLYFDPIETRFRVVEVLTIQPAEWLGGQVAFVYQRDQNFLGIAGENTQWYSTGGRMSLGITQHFKLVGEAGVDYVTKSNGAEPQWLAKFTAAPTLTSERGFMARPELRVFYTWATWNSAAQTATIDSGRLYTDTYPNHRSGATFGLQAETWF